MDRLPELSANELMERTRGEFEQLMRDVAAAVNAAPEGQVINRSEAPVRDLLREFRRRVYHVVPRSETEFSAVDDHSLSQVPFSQAPKRSGRLARY